MDSYTKEELEEALRIISSTIINYGLCFPGHG
jgi:hypothetical protein